ncbi:MAG: hypothetical protein GTN80_07225 [Nitrososphaeria archaeon]|nr:hypothetical protein [Nitrososphaeria archaeon]
MRKIYFWRGHIVPGLLDFSVVSGLEMLTREDVIQYVQAYFKSRKGTGGAKRAKLTSKGR